MMKACRLVPLTAAFVLLVSCANRTGNDSAAQAPSTESFVLHSQILNEDRTINVRLPLAYGASAGARPRSFPVLYMPDGGLDEDFPHVTAAVDSLVGERLIRPVIVVGIPNTQRRRDLTSPTSVASEAAIAPKVGGAALFRQFIKKELLPEVNRRYRTTSERSIIGESLAGLFVVETLLEEPRLFTHYIALDPSLWWNHAALLDTARSQLAALDPSPRTLYLASSKDDIGSRVAQFSALIKEVAPARLTLRYDSRPDLTHATIFHGVENTALREALR
jgi:predicted alpha/beta superfamily hydrolase